MNDRNEPTLAVVVERLYNFTDEVRKRDSADQLERREFRQHLEESHANLKDSIDALRLLQREQNSNVSKAFERLNLFDTAARKRDDRLDALEDVNKAIDHDNDIRHGEWRKMAAVFTSGATVPVIVLLLRLLGYLG